MFKIFKQIGRDTIILTLGTISTRALGFILMPLYTKTFSTEEYGIIEMINISAQMAGIIMAIGMASAFTREYLQNAETEEERMEVFGTSFLFVCVFSFFVGVIVFALSNKIALSLSLDNPIVPGLFRLIFIKTYFLTLGIIALRYLIVSGRMAIYAFLSFLYAALIILSSVWVLLMQKGDLCELYLYHAIITSVFGIGYSIFILHRAGFKWVGKRLRNMLSFALPMVPAAISFYIMTSSDRFFLQKLTSTSDVGIYGVAYKIGLLLQAILVMPLTTALSPYIYRIAKREDGKLVLQHLFEIVCFVLMLGAISFSLAAPYLVRLLSPVSYWRAASVVIWISIAYALYGLNFVLVAGINISGKSYYQMVAITIAAVLNLFLNGLLIPSWGIIGAAIATTIAYLIQTLLTGFFAQRLYPIPYRFMRTFLIVCIIIFCYWVLNLAPLEPLMTMIIAKFLFFILAVLILSMIFFPKEILAVWNKIKFVFLLKNSRRL